ncbi:swi5-like zinc finger protein [Desmophyllum pertusum]|uniref:DNA repair protein SWI5 homolog n=1 Tax=Desmophyllum pertusum TaxID=174260 RepID=A0A9W9YCY1_9CNID|nr:swi5-like zinc finger protein [Desmophyllum pertusum]
MAAKTANSEDCVLNSFKGRNEPLTLDEILELSSLSSLEAEKALQRLEDQQKICSHFINEADTTVYALNARDSDAKCKFETQNTPKQLLTTPGTFRKRPLASRSSSKLRQPFKSPLQTRLQNTVVEDKVSLLEEIDSLKAKLDILNKDITELSKEYSEEELQLHIQKLHEYNEIKDVGQLLIGKLAEIDGTTTRAMYQEFGLDLED